MRALPSILATLGVAHTAGAQVVGRYADVNGLKMYYEVHNGAGTTRRRRRDVIMRHSRGGSPDVD